MLNGKVITLFGGSGFVGKAVVSHLAAAGYTIRIASRTPKSCYALTLMGVPGQVIAQFYNPARPDTISAAVSGSDAVINCVGTLFEKRRRTFHAAHVELPRQIATACKLHHVGQFVHISALGVDANTSAYAASKRQGEQVIKDIFPKVTILRPSVIFGPDDSFFNMFARMAQFLPALPLIGGGKTRFQPVYVDDVARAVTLAVTKQDMQGKTYELAGPDTLTFKELYQKLFQYTGRPRALIPLSPTLARVKAWFFEFLPVPPLTRDQITSLKYDNVTSSSALTFKDIGIIPVAMDSILPTYLSCYRDGGKYGDFKHA